MRLWDDCLEHESYIRSNTAHGIYKLYGEVHNINQFSEFEWFEWVMFQEKTTLYMDEHFKLRSHLGSSIDIVSAMMAKIVKKNSQVLLRSTYHALTQDE